MRLRPHRPALLAIAIAALVVATALYVHALQSQSPEVPAAAPAETTAAPAPGKTAAPTSPAPKPKRAQRPRKLTRKTFPKAPEEEEEEEEEEPALALVEGRVLDGRGRPQAGTMVRCQVDGRRRRFPTGEDGSFQFEVNAGHLMVWAERRDGPLVARSDKVALDATEGGEWEVDLVLELATQGGLGIRVAAHNDGAFIRRVVPGTPAQELGLMRGDIITQVAGEDVAGMAVPDITGKLIGPVGSTQTFTIRRLDGSTTELEFDRVEMGK